MPVGREGVLEAASPLRDNIPRTRRVLPLLVGATLIACTPQVEPPVYMFTIRDAPMSGTAAECEEMGDKVFVLKDASTGDVLASGDSQTEWVGAEDGLPGCRWSVTGDLVRRAGAYELSGMEGARKLYFKRDELVDTGWIELRP